MDKIQKENNLYLVGNEELKLLMESLTIDILQKRPENIVLTLFYLISIARIHFEVVGKRIWGKSNM